MSSKPRTQEKIGSRVIRTTKILKVFKEQIASLRPPGGLI